MNPIKNEAISQAGKANSFVNPIEAAYFQGHKFIGFSKSINNQSVKFFSSKESLNKNGFRPATLQEIFALFQSHMNRLNNPQKAIELQNYAISIMQMESESDQFVAKFHQFALKKIGILTYNSFIAELDRAEKGEIDFSEIEKFLKNPNFKFDINSLSTDGNQHTALARAVYKKNPKQVHFLLSHGASIWIPDKLGNLPIHYAACLSDPRYLQMLIAHDRTEKHLNMQNRDGTTPVHMAANFKFTSHLELLIAHKANVDARDFEQRTPLHYACIPCDNCERQSLHNAPPSLMPNESISLLLKAKADPKLLDISGAIALHFAAKHCTSPIYLEEMIACGADYMFADKNKDTPVDAAIAHGNTTISEFLIELALKEGKLNLKNPSTTEKALVWSAIQSLDNTPTDIERLKILKKLLTKFNFSPSFWHKILESLISQKHTQAFEAIYKWAAEIEKQDELKPYLSSLFKPDKKRNGGTIFHTAAAGQSPEIMALLLRERDKDSALSLKNLQGLIPLCCALKVKDPTEATDKIIQMLLPLYQPSNDPNDLPEIMLCAAKVHNWNALDSFLAGHVKDSTNISYNDSKNETLLHILLKNPEVPSKYLKWVFNRKDVDLLAPNREGQTPLEICVTRQRDYKNLLSLFGALYDRGLAETALTKESSPGNTVLVEAVSYASKIDVTKNTTGIQIFDAFIEILSRFPNLKFFEAETQKHEINPMIIAAHNGSAHVLRKLIDLSKTNKSLQGLITKPDRKGNVSLHFAVKHNNESLLKLYKDQGIFFNIANYASETPLWFAAKYKASKAVQFLLSHGADPNKRTLTGHTPLHASANVNDCNSILMLLNAGANPNIRSLNGQTPLHAAVEGEAREAISCLLKGVQDKEGRFITSNYKLSNEKGLTPLHLAAGLEFFHTETGRRGHTHIINAFQGVNTEAVDKSSKTPLHYAVIKGIMANVAFLLGNTKDHRKAIEHKDKEHKNAFIHAFENNQFHLIPFLISKAPPKIYQHLMQLLGDNMPLDPVGGKAWIPLLSAKGISLNTLPLGGLLEVCLFFHDVNFAKLIFKQLPPSTFNLQLTTALNELAIHYPEKTLQWLKIEAQYVKQNLEISHTPTPNKTYSHPLPEKTWEAAKTTLLIKAKKVKKMSGKADYSVVFSDFYQQIGSYLKNIDRFEIAGLESLSHDDRDVFHRDITNTLHLLANCLKNATDGFSISQALVYIYESAGLCHEGYSEGATMALKIFRDPTEDTFPVEEKHMLANFISAKRKAFAFIGELSLGCANSLMPLQKTIKGETIDPGLDVHVGNQIKRIVRQRTTINWEGIGSGADHHMGNITIDKDTINHTFDKFLTTHTMLSKFKEELKSGEQLRKSLMDIRDRENELNVVKEKINKALKNLATSDENARKNLEIEIANQELRKKELEVAKEKDEKQRPALKKELDKILSPEELRAVLELAASPEVKKDRVIKLNAINENINKALIKAATADENTRKELEIERGKLELIRNELLKTETPSAEEERRIEFINNQYYDDDFQINESGLILILKELGILQDANSPIKIAPIVARPPSPIRRDLYELKERENKHDE